MIIKRPFNDRSTTVQQSKEKKRKENNTITHSDESVSTCFSFDEFYEAYGKKKDRKRAEQVYRKLNEKDRQAIKDTIQLYLKANPDVQFRKYPLTYLNGRNWEDDLTEATVKEKEKKQSFDDFDEFGYA